MNNLTKLKDIKTLTDRLPLIGVYLLFSYAYKLVNMYNIAYNHNFTDLTMTIDQLIPFNANFIFVYVSWYMHCLVLGLCILLFKDKYYWRKLMLNGCAIMTIGMIFFVVYPTRITRMDINSFTGLTGFLFNWLYGIDAPVNCFPSLHVALAALFNLEFIVVWQKLMSEFHSLKSRLFYWLIQVCVGLWTLTIFYSTVAVRQHFFIDIIGGLGLTLVVTGLSRLLWPPKLKAI